MIYSKMNAITESTDHRLGVMIFIWDDGCPYTFSAPTNLSPWKRETFVPTEHTRDLRVGMLFIVLQRMNSKYVLKPIFLLDLQSNQREVKIDQQSMKLTQTELKSNQQSMNSTQTELKSNQQSMKSTQKELKSNQQSMKSTQTELKATQEEINGNAIQLYYSKYRLRCK